LTWMLEKFEYRWWPTWVVVNRWPSHWFATSFLSTMTAMLTKVHRYRRCHSEAEEHINTHTHTHTHTHRVNFLYKAGERARCDLRFWFRGTCWIKTSILNCWPLARRTCSFQCCARTLSKTSTRTRPSTMREKKNFENEMSNQVNEGTENWWYDMI
jgi:hypothetical protein